MFLNSLDSIVSGKGLRRNFIYDLVPRRVFKGRYEKTTVLQLESTKTLDTIGLYR